jgi:hypothetical protein
MNDAECSAFANDTDYECMVMMRKFDEQAKETDVVLPSFDSFKDLLTNSSVFVSTSNFGGTSNSCYLLSDAQMQFWKNNGFLKVSNLLHQARVDINDVSKWVDDIADWPKRPDAYLQHYELSSATDPRTGQLTQSTVICRTENFVNYHADMSHLVKNVLLMVVSQLFGEAAVLFKEKVNYKMAGGGGFAAHQDTPAYIGLATDHVSAMVGIDAATVENGCLEMAVGRY